MFLINDFDLTSTVTSSLILSRSSSDSSSCSCSDSSPAAAAAAVLPFDLLPANCACAVAAPSRSPKVRLGWGILGLDPLRGEDDGSGSGSVGDLVEKERADRALPIDVPDIEL